MKSLRQWLNDRKIAKAEAEVAAKTKQEQRDNEAREFYRNEFDDIQDSLVTAGIAPIRKVNQMDKGGGLLTVYGIGRNGELLKITINRNGAKNIYKV